MFTCVDCDIHPTHCEIKKVKSVLGRNGVAMSVETCHAPRRLPACSKQVVSSVGLWVSRGMGEPFLSARMSADTGGDIEGWRV